MAWVFVMMGHTDSTAVLFVKSSDSVSGDDMVHHSPKCVRCSVTVGCVNPGFHGPTDCTVAHQSITISTATISACTSRVGVIIKLKSLHQKKKWRAYCISQQAVPISTPPVSEREREREREREKERERKRERKRATERARERERESGGERATSHSKPVGVAMMDRCAFPSLTLVAHMLIRRFALHADHQHVGVRPTTRSRETVDSVMPDRLPITPNDGRMRHTCGHQHTAVHQKTSVGRILRLVPYHQL